MNGIVNGGWFALALALSWAGLANAQETAGKAEVAYQQYYLRIGDQPATNAAGLAVSYSQFVPNVGLLSVGLAPALNSGKFRTGDDYARLNGLPWQGQYWDFSLGDFRLPGQLLPAGFTNLFLPEIDARGVSVEASHGGRTVGLFYGTGTIANTPRVVLRMSVPQTLAGFYVRQRLTNRLTGGLRLMRFRNDTAKLDNLRAILTNSSQVKSATTVT